MKRDERSHQADPSGLQTLERFAKADHFNHWLFQTIEPFCKGHVLEAGSGIGNLSKFFLKNKFTLTVSDLRAEYCSVLKEKFSAEPGLAGVETIDLSREDFASEYAALLGRFDTVIALNVVEHIEDDAAAVRNCCLLLRPGGRLVILVPAFQLLYNPFDVELGHFRRYNRYSLKKLMQKEELSVVRCWYFNALGILGWAVNGWLLGKKLIPQTQLALFDRLVPLAKLFDRLGFYSIGLSVIAVGDKP
ncbi:MAG TPA: methyltransferase domain-containing protein [Flavisolibacter sp.]|nr:methyltransferase domain-containing protein [Flavisolibacter sp.]